MRVRGAEVEECVWCGADGVEFASAFGESLVRYAGGLLIGGRTYGG